MSNEITPNPSVPSQVVAEVKFPQVINNLGIIPTSYKDSMSYYETLAWLCKYLEETVIPSVNQNGNAVRELQSLYMQLNDYVTHYFDNLDVQEEINNKLDEMAESGVLQDIVAQIFDELDQKIDDVEDSLDTKIDSVNDSLNVKIDAVSSGTPAGTYDTKADLVASDPDHNRIYVVLADNYWYYYNTLTHEWTAGGLYQANQINSKDDILDGRNVIKENFPIYNGYAKYDFIDNLEIGAITGQTGDEISFNNNDTRIHTTVPLASGSYKFINFENTSFNIAYTLTDLNNIVIAGSPWITTRDITITVPANQQAYLHFRRSNNASISINDVNKVLRQPEGTIDYELPTFDNMLPIEIDSYNGTIKFPVNSRFMFNKKLYTISGETTISYTHATTNIFKILYKIADNSLVCVTYNTIPDYDYFIVGVFTTYPYRILSIKLNGRILINGERINSLAIPLNNIVNLKVINKNAGASGITEESSSLTRVTLDDYMRGNGKIEITNLDTTNLKYGFHTLVKNIDGTYTRTGDSGWITDSKRVFTLDPTKYYNLFFSKINGSDSLTPKEVADNIIIKNIEDNQSSIIRPVVPNFASVGHQGFGAGTNGYRGNSRSGFVAGALHGFNELECDVIATVDNVIVLSHDDTVTTDSSESITISETSYSTLSTKLFGGETICTLDEYLGICKKYGCKARIDHIDTISSNSTAMANMIEDIRTNAMSGQITLTCNPSLWSDLNDEFPSATYLYGSLTQLSDLTESYVTNTILAHKTDTNKVGLALNYETFNNSTTIGIISQFSDVIFEFWTVDNLTTYKTLQKYSNGITSNSYTAYDALLS